MTEGNLIKLAIGVPTVGFIKTRTVISLFAAVWNTPHPMHMIIQEGCYVQENRNVIVNQAKLDGCSHLMFVDSDMVFEKDAINRLLAHDKDIVGANYNARLLPLQSTVKIADGNGKLIAVPDYDFPKELFQVHAVATGFMLVKMSAFDRIPRPWFFLDEDEKGGTIGDDVWFCRQAAKAGIPVWCDPTIPVKHCGDYLY